MSGSLALTNDPANIAFAPAGNQSDARDDVQVTGQGKVQTGLLTSNGKAMQQVGLTTGKPLPVLLTSRLSSSDVPAEYQTRLDEGRSYVVGGSVSSTDADVVKPDSLLNQPADDVQPSLDKAVLLAASNTPAPLAIKPGSVVSDINVGLNQFNEPLSPLLEKQSSGQLVAFKVPGTAPQPLPYLRVQQQLTPYMGARGMSGGGSFMRTMVGIFDMGMKYNILTLQQMKAEVVQKLVPQALWDSWSPRAQAYMLDYIDRAMSAIPNGFGGGVGPDTLEEMLPTQITIADQMSVEDGKAKPQPQTPIDPIQPPAHKPSNVTPPVQRQPPPVPTAPPVTTTTPTDADREIQRLIEQQNKEQAVFEGRMRMWDRNSNEQKQMLDLATKTQHQAFKATNPVQQARLDQLHQVYWNAYLRISVAGGSVMPDRSQWNNYRSYELQAMGKVRALDDFIKQHPNLKLPQGTQVVYGRIPNALDKDGVPRYRVGFTDLAGIKIELPGSTPANNQPVHPVQMSAASTRRDVGEIPVGKTFFYNPTTGELSDRASANTVEVRILAASSTQSNERMPVHYDPDNKSVSVRKEGDGDVSGWVDMNSGKVYDSQTGGNVIGNIPRPPNGGGGGRYNSRNNTENPDDGEKLPDLSQLRRPAYNQQGQPLNKLQAMLQSIGRALKDMGTTYNNLSPETKVVIGTILIGTGSTLIFQTVNVLMSIGQSIRNETLANQSNQNAWNITNHSLKEQRQIQNDAQTRNEALLKPADLVPLPSVDIELITSATPAMNYVERGQLVQKILQHFVDAAVKRLEEGGISKERVAAFKEQMNAYVLTAGAPTTLEADKTEALVAGFPLPGSIGDTKQNTLLQATYANMVSQARSAINALAKYVNAPQQPTPPKPSAVNVPGLLLPTQPTADPRIAELKQQAAQYIKSVDSLRDQAVSAIYTKEDIGQYRLETRPELQFPDTSYRLRNQDGTYNADLIAKEQTRVREAHITLTSLSAKVAALRAEALRAQGNAGKAGGELNAAVDELNRLHQEINTAFKGLTARLEALNELKNLAPSTSLESPGNPTSIQRPQLPIIELPSGSDTPLLQTPLHPLDVNPQPGETPGATPGVTNTPQ